MESCFKLPKKNLHDIGLPYIHLPINLSIVTPPKTNMEYKTDTFQKRNLLFQQTLLFQMNHVTLPETNIAPENRPLEVWRFLLETTILGANRSFQGV